MSNTKKTWKEKLLTFMQENAEYFEGILYCVRRGFHPVQQIIDPIRAEPSAVSKSENS